MPTVRTIAKASYTPTNKDGKGRAKAGLRYYANRPDQERLTERDRDKNQEKREEQDRHTRPSREAFTDSPQDSLDLRKADRFIDDSPGKYAYRIVLSPDPQWGQHMQKEDLKSWAREVMQELQDKRQQDIPYLGYVHEDPKHPHVHVVALTETTLRKDDLSTLRQTGDREAERMLGLERQAAEPYQQRIQEQPLSWRQEQMEERLERILHREEPGQKFHDKPERQKEQEQEEERSKSWGIDLGY